MQIQPISEHSLSTVSSLDADLQKWQKKLQEFEMDTSLVHTHPELVRFLFESGSIFQMICFRNSSEQGKEQHVVRAERNTVFLRVEGRLVSWEEFSKRVEYDKETNRVVTRANFQEGWNYISPDGFVPKERFEYQTIYPVEQLSTESYESLVEHAKKFFLTNPEQHPDEKKDAIYQIVTSRRDWGIGESYWTHNLIDNLPRHISLRLIDNSGKVYSFGIEMKKKQSEPLTSCFPYTCLTTTNANIAALDFEETHLFQERLITSVPLSQARLEQAVQYLSKQNQEGIRFNLMKQNCTSLGRKLLQDVGYDVDTGYTFYALLSSMCPTLSDMPYIGKALDVVVRIISVVAFHIFATVARYAPNLVLHGISYVSLTFQRIGIVMRNLVVLTLGGGCSAYWMEPIPNEKKDLLKPFLYLNRVVHRWSDLLKEETFDLHYSQKVVEWQRKQQSTHIHLDPKRPALFF